MRKMPRPKHVTRNVFTLCIKSVRDQDLLRRLKAITGSLAAGETAYIEMAEAVALHKFPRSAVVGQVSTDELKKVYTDRFVPKTGDSRHIYDEMVATAPRSRCPLCGVGHVSTLDHHLPKADYPILSVTPVNLVPACTWCQNSKLQTYPATEEEQTLHPYFDDFENVRWLFAKVIEGEPASFSYAARQPKPISQSAFQRLENHLKVFQLGRLFGSNAAEELLNIRFGLQKVYDTGGAQAVREHLAEQAQSRENVFKNSWQTAMYWAATESEWFCDGGFALA